MAGVSDVSGVRVDVPRWDGPLAGVGFQGLMLAGPVRGSRQHAPELIFNQIFVAW